MMASQKVHVVRVENGVAYVNDTIKERLTAFSFGKILGYRGQTAEELKLKPGKEVSIEYDVTGDKVSSVTLQP